MILSIVGLFVMKIIDTPNTISVTVTVVTVKIMTIMTNDSVRFSHHNTLS